MHNSEAVAQRTARHEPGAFRKEGDFLKELIERLGREEYHQVCDNLAKAEREEKCIRRAMFLVGMLFMLSLVGLSYCAILLPEIFHNPRHVVTQGLCYLGLGSLISQGAFLANYLWHRAVVGRLRRECRRVVLALAESQRKASAMASHAVYGDTQPLLKQR